MKKKPNCRKGMSFSRGSKGGGLGNRKGSNMSLKVCGGGWGDAGNAAW